MILVTTTAVYCILLLGSYSNVLFASVTALVVYHTQQSLVIGSCWYYQCQVTTTCFVRVYDQHHNGARHVDTRGPPITGPKCFIP